jgi:hypothetical protein
MVSKTATVLGPFHSNLKKILPVFLPVTTVENQIQNLVHSFILQPLLLLLLLLKTNLKRKHQISCVGMRVILKTNYCITDRVLLFNTIHSV